MVTLAMPPRRLYHEIKRIKLPFFLSYARSQFSFVRKRNESKNSNKMNNSNNCTMQEFAQMEREGKKVSSVKFFFYATAAVIGNALLFCWINRTIFQNSIALCLLTETNTIITMKGRFRYQKCICQHWNRMKRKETHTQTYTKRLLTDKNRIFSTSLVSFECATWRSEHFKCIFSIQCACV